MTTQTETHQFQAETRQLLDLMIHSLYSHKEIFLRELISNASDALDRLRFESLTQPDLLDGNPELYIRLDPDPDPTERTLTVIDNGIGMSREELVQNIGTIAHSGTRGLAERLAEAKEQSEDGELPPEFIGQFGVGFYSAFMAADRIVIDTLRAGEKTGTRWESSGDGTYQLSESDKETRGTEITLHLKPAAADDGLEDFTSEYVLTGVVKKYSDFVTYPIKLEVSREEVERDEQGQPKEGAEPTRVIEDKILNSMKAIWTRPPSEVTEEEYTEFYRHVSHDWMNAPFRTIRQHGEGTLEYDALLFLPSKAPHELYYHAYQAGLQLYVKKVKILEQCEDLMPRYLRFVKGVVDCADLPLNVSREMLQHTRTIGQIKTALTKKVLGALEEVRDEQPEEYRKFWDELGRALKEGVAEDFNNKDRILDLLLLASSHAAEDLTTLKAYVERMPEGQENIYYITGESRMVLENLPHLEALRDKGYEVLYLTDPVDELMVQHLSEYDDKKLRSAGKGELDLGDEKDREEAKKEREEQEKEHEKLLEHLQKTLDEHVKQVRLSGRLTSSPACLVGAEHDYSPRLEKLLLKGEGGGPKQRRILEINPGHPLFQQMSGRFAANAEDPVVNECAEVLFGQALLSEGLELPDPVRFSRLVSELMVRSMSQES